ncbi:MAG: ABC transporter permease, partial [Lachnospiraceae bacterium]|nr:ABC transporter permease [Lachnospiraceae bacterium]
KTIFGRHLLAVGGNSQAAEVSGINKARVTMLVSIFMGLCAAIGALIMTGRAASAQPEAGSGMEMDAIAAVIIGGTTLGGGTGKVLGSLVGVLIIGMISNGLNLLGVDTNWQLVAKGLIIVAAVFLDYQTGQISSRLSNRASK